MKWMKVKCSIFFALFLSIVSCDSEDATPNLEAGLVAYYPFNGNAEDESQNGNTGTVFGPVLAPDRFGNENAAYLFDGVDDHIDLGTSSVFDLSNYDQFSVSFWVISEKVEGNGIETILSRYDASSGDCSYAFERAQSFSSVFFRFFVDCESQTSAAGNGGPFNFGVWSNYTWLYDNGNMDVYVDGRFVQLATFSIPINASQASTIVGAKNFSNDFYDESFTGAIDDIRIYNRLLSRDEIELISNQ